MWIERVKDARVEFASVTIQLVNALPFIVVDCPNPDQILTKGCQAFTSRIPIQRLDLMSMALEWQRKIYIFWSFLTTNCNQLSINICKIQDVWIRTIGKTCNAWTRTCVSASNREIWFSAAAARYLPWRGWNLTWVMPLWNWKFKKCKTWL